LIAGAIPPGNAIFDGCWARTLDEPSGYSGVYTGIGATLWAAPPTGFAADWRIGCVTSNCKQHRRMLPIEFDKVTIVAAPQTPSAFSDLVSVLVMVGLPAGPANRALSRHAIDPLPRWGRGERLQRPCPPATLPRCLWDPTGSRTLSSACVWPLLRPMRRSSSRVTVGRILLVRTRPTGVAPSREPPTPKSMWLGLNRHDRGPGRPGRCASGRPGSRLPG
jgi:hypothetical protein